MLDRLPFDNNHYQDECGVIGTNVMLCITESPSLIPKCPPTRSSGTPILEQIHRWPVNPLQLILEGRLLDFPLRLLASKDNYLQDSQQGSSL